jgi:MOSC domain-containing protein
MIHLTVADLYVYPVKSCRGVRLASAEVARTGLRLDRRWMIVDERGMFVAQRGVGGLGVGIRTMCLIEPEITADSGLTLAAPGMPRLTVARRRIENPARDVQLWRRHRRAIDEGDEAANWCTTFLSRERPGIYRLMRLPDDDQTAPTFADSAPVLFIAEASLDALNRRLADPVPMDRFRPNVVLAGGVAHIEDSLTRVRIAEVEFAGAGLCVRCPMPTIDQRTADQGKEPLRTLATYRTTDDGVVFGRHFRPTGMGTIAVGDPATPITQTPERSRS